MREKVLLVDDDAKLRGLLAEFLEGYGCRVISLPDGTNIRETVIEHSPDIIILDIMMPKYDGLEILRELRKDFTLPVIMLTAKGEDADRIVGLELGADDYLPKPFNPRELLARMKAVLRRVTPNGQLKVLSMPAEDSNITVAGLELNRSRRTLLVEGEEVELSLTEFRLLEVLMTHPNIVLSRDELMNKARGRDFFAFDRSIDVHISKLRAKLKPYPEYYNTIKTVWGSGYMFVDE